MRRGAETMDTKQAMRLLLAGAGGLVGAALFAPALAKTYSNALTRRQKDLGKRKEGYAGKPIPIELERESTSVDEELSRQTILLRQKQEEMTMVTAKYDTIKQRWREILADQERTAAAA